MARLKQASKKARYAASRFFSCAGVSVRPNCVTYFGEVFVVFFMARLLEWLRVLRGFVVCGHGFNALAPSRIIALAVMCAPLCPHRASSRALCWWTLPCLLSVRSARRGSVGAQRRASGAEVPD